MRPEKASGPLTRSAPLPGIRPRRVAQQGGDGWHEAERGSPLSYDDQQAQGAYHWKKGAQAVPLSQGHPYGEAAKGQEIDTRQHRG